MAEIPTLKETQDHFGSKGFALLGISLDESRDALDKKVKAAGVDWTIGFDGKGWKAGPALRYNIHSIPSNWLIDRDGTIRKKNPEPGDIGDLVADLLGEGKGKAAPSSGGKSGE